MSSFFIHPKVIKRLSHARRQYKKRLIQKTKYIYYFIDPFTKYIYYSYEKSSLIAYLNITETDIARDKEPFNNFQLFKQIYKPVKIEHYPAGITQYTLAFFRAKDIFSYLLAVIPAKLPFTNMQTLRVKPVNSSTFRIYHKTQLVIEFTIEKTIDRKYTYFITRNPFNLKL